LLRLGRSGRLERPGRLIMLTSHHVSISSICGPFPLVNITDMSYIPNMAPDLIFPVKKLVNLTEEQAAQITEFRYDQRLPSDNEAIRRLIEMGLRATKSGVEYKG
jgi:hypothetical protein